MKITHINIENILGVSRVDTALPTPIALFAGDNYAGKSSIREAVKLAVLGQPERVLLKKEYHRLVHDSADTGVAAVEIEGGRATFTAPKGEQELRHGYTMDAFEPMRLALPYCLDPELFAATKPDERRTLLFAITGASAKTADIVAALGDRGLTEKMVQTVTPLLRSGFPAAAKYAEERAREAKADWKAVTSETYGHVKAETWAAAMPAVAVDIAAIEQMVTKTGTLRAKIGTEQTRLGAAEQKLKAWNTASENQAADRKTFAGLANLETKLAREQDELTQWTDQVKLLEGQAGTGPRVGLVHDLARAVDWLMGVYGGLVPDEHAEALSSYENQHGSLDSKINPEAATKLPAAIKARDTMQRCADNTRRDIDAAKAAGARLSQTVEKGSEAEVVSIREFLRGYEDELAKVTFNLGALQSDRTVMDSAKAKTAQARDHHQTVQQWQIAIDALSPDGIPAEILGRALSPINRLLVEASSVFGWARTEIDSDMTVTTAGRPHALLSESEKWRADAIIALVLAQASGLKMVALDRFDVLDLAGRSDCINGLDAFAEDGEIDTALIFGTLKKLPNFEQFQSVTGFWVEGGTIAEKPADVRRVA